MFEKILGNRNLGDLLGNADEIAAKFGMPAEKVQPLIESLSSRLGQGGNQMSALIETAREHDIPVERLEEVFRGFGKNDAENPVENLAGMLARGLFGGKK